MLHGEGIFRYSVTEQRKFTKEPGDGEGHKMEDLVINTQSPTPSSLSHSLSLSLSVSLSLSPMTPPTFPALSLHNELCIATARHLAYSIYEKSSFDVTSHPAKRERVREVTLPSCCF